MKQINLPQKQHKTMTTRKIMKLRKIKKIKNRKIKTSKTSTYSHHHGIKREEGQTKKNESNFGISSIQQIKQRTNSLIERINTYRNTSDELIPKMTYNNTNDQTNFIISDEEFESRRTPSLFSISPGLRLLSEEEFESELPPRQHNIFQNILDAHDYDFEREIENLNLSSPINFPERELNMSNLVSENLGYYRNNISLVNINNSNGNELNPQNGNANNNNHLLNINNSNGNELNPQNGNTNNNNNHLLNINNSNRNELNPQNRNRNSDTNIHDSILMHLLHDLILEESYDILSRINRTEIRNIKKKLTKIKFNNTVSSSRNIEKCTICFEKFKRYQEVYDLPCHHLFHKSCLNNEIKFRQKCPICRREL